MEPIMMAWAALIIAQGFDVWTTNRVLSQGGSEEVWLTRQIMEIFGDAWGYVKAGASIALVYAATMLFPDDAVLVVGSGAVAIGLVGLNNFRKIK